MPAILDRKPSGLTLCRLDCGCEIWLGATRVGRRVASCGEGFTHDRDKAPGGHAIGHFIQQAQALLANDHEGDTTP